MTQTSTIGFFKFTIDMGCDLCRKNEFKTEGIIAADAKLTARTKHLPVWDVLLTEHKLLCENQDIGADTRSPVT